jgi:glucosamine-6-phosphate deaminase
MDCNLFDHINIDKANTRVPDGMATYPEAECARYDALIDGFGAIDVQLLGIGPNGHIGFNEPADVFSRGTQYIRLTASTIAANARFFANPADVPKYAVTMGIRHIMLAKKIVLVAGAEKKDILNQAMNGDITPQLPASVLQMHPDTTVIAIS